MSKRQATQPLEDFFSAPAGYVGQAQDGLRRQTAITAISLKRCSACRCS